MQESALLSVIIPIYNGELYLEQTIESILQASWKELELLLIDDGSRDGSSLICRKYEQADKRVHYIRTENHGIVQARNRGLEEAQGKYVCFCDQDDLVDAQMYSNLLAHMMMENADIGMCSTGRLLGEKNYRMKPCKMEYIKKSRLFKTCYIRYCFGDIAIRLCKIIFIFTGRCGNVFFEEAFWIKMNCGFVNL